MMLGSFYALMAGCLGSAASLSAKLTLGADYFLEMCQVSAFPTQSVSSACHWLHIPLRLLCVGLMFACNAAMWTFFSKALHACSSSASATVTSTAANFISSAILGKMIFGESHALQWWLGIALTLCGLLMLHGSTPQPHHDTKDD
ncbi:transmembrane protein 42-like isoform X2 [Nerophis ophidion]|uniref:transmembrane protein 42-like isoform X2 n=1 Tax=Nerophis ophidion TaxID=159077 RepID=UPI002AE0532C|nr:transmembrane protein 42-like isoform X2 [Nerophis ophidion]